MIIKEFNNIDEIQKYYDEIHMSYYFNDMDLVILNFNLDVKAIIFVPNIIARDIKAFCIMADNYIYANDIDANAVYGYQIHAHNINAKRIHARGDIIACNIKANLIKGWDIKATSIIADVISYWSVCFAYYDIKCKSIVGTTKNSKHFALNGTLEIENDK